MKVPEEYGGLGLSQIYCNRALARVPGEIMDTGVVPQGRDSRPPARADD